METNVTPKHALGYKTLGRREAGHTKKGRTDQLHLEGLRTGN